jgi:DNA repair photolyase
MGEFEVEPGANGQETVRVMAGRAVGPVLDGKPVHGRGARSNASGRFEAERREAFDDGWDQDEEPASIRTVVKTETARSIITTNDSPDISFDQSINPYRGCEHGCSYCYARPTHCFLGHSAGLDFETRLYAKGNAAELLERELANPRYVPRTIALGTATDPYQPIERQRLITRRILEVLEVARHPVGIVTKSALVTRDIDILSRLAKNNLVKVALSVTTLDRLLARRMEPRASTPERRLDAIRQLSASGVSTQVMMAPIIPGLNDSEIERILEVARDAGARQAGYVTLRLPLELKDLFREWLATDVPDRANRVLNLLRDMHGGRDYTAEFGLRQRGSGPYAQQIALRFRLALRRLGLNERRQPLRTDLFVRPVPVGGQMSLFDGDASDGESCG